MDIENRKNSIKEELLKLHAVKDQKDGRLPAIRRMDLLFDEGSFVETNAFVSGDGNGAEGVVTGYGAVDGRLVFAWSQDYSRGKGALGIAGAKKIAELYMSALKNGAPVAAVFDSDGAKLNEGTDAVAAYGVILKAAANAKFKIPRVSLVVGVCSGANAAAALQSDILIMAGPNAVMSLSPVSVLRETGGGENAGTSAYNEKQGLVSMTADTEEQGLAYVRAVLNYLPSNKKSKTHTLNTADSAERGAAGMEGMLDGAYDMRTLISALVDDKKAVELNGAYGSDFITALASINGFACGIVATNPAVNEGKITSDGANKASHFIDMCGAFGLGVITIADCAGYDAGDETQNGDIARKIARLAGSYAKLSSPVITVIAGKASGSAFTVLGGKALGADMVFALPSAQIEVMPADAAVNFMWNEKLAKADDGGAARERLTAEWEQQMSTPLEAARKGHIDFICDFAELRSRLASALSMLAMKKDFGKS